MKELTKHISSQSSSILFKHKMIDYHLLVAKLYASLSTAERLKCGAALATPDNSRIIMCGYNGTLSGLDNSCEEDFITKEEVVHAEQNVLMACAKLGISTDGCVLYCTHSPCIDCAKLIATAGISRVYFNSYYRRQEGLELLQRAGVQYFKRSYCNKLLRS